MLVHHTVIPSIKFASTHVFTWAKRDTVRVRCLAQEHNKMVPVKVRARIPRSSLERTNHEATAPPHKRGPKVIQLLRYISLIRILRAILLKSMLVQSRFQNSQMSRNRRSCDQNFPGPHVHLELLYTFFDALIQNLYNALINIRRRVKYHT